MLISVYILDDDLYAVRRLSQLLEKHFPEVEIVGSNSIPEKAIKAIQEIEPDLVFSDVEMPRLSGFEVLRELESNGFKGKFVFTTAFDQYLLKALRAQALDYLLKPIDIEEMKDAIERFRTRNMSRPRLKSLERFGLSQREIEIVAHLSDGKSSEEIASELSLSKYTINTHRRNILQKTGVKNTVELLNLM